MRFNVRCVVDGLSIGTFSFTSQIKAEMDAEHCLSLVEDGGRLTVETWVSYEIPEGGEVRE